ncbi:Hypothetical predicted protein [Mytilus galloprovincialis]|uniref:Uncharacterized protein n=1 Tax=Mytilus galloprovincialis TaxID=29158 RepID=A0A8B6FLK8_MYTGA|nr:Hypothetical predicted protein [Mytilus galloprovincialis]
MKPIPSDLHSLFFYFDVKPGYNKEYGFAWCESITNTLITPYSVCAGPKCDNEFGCVKVEQTTLITTYDTAHTEEYLVNNFTQTTLSYQESKTNAQRPSIAQLKNQNYKDILNVTNKYIPTDIGEHKTVVVIVGTTSFLIFVFICVLVVYCMCRKLRPRKIFQVIPNNSPDQQDNNGHRNSLHNETEDDINAYAEIDEERMCPDSPRSRTDQTSSDSNSSSSNKDSKESVNDGYINPYQALITDSKMKINSEVVFEQEDKKEDEQQRNYSKLENNVISEKVEKTNNNPAKVIYLELEDMNNAEIKPVVESENTDKKEDAIEHHIEWTFKRLNTM